MNEKLYPGGHKHQPICYTRFNSSSSNSTIILSTSCNLWFWFLHVNIEKF